MLLTLTLNKPLDPIKPMFKRRNFFKQCVLTFLLTGLLTNTTQKAQAESEKVSQTFNPLPSVTSIKPSIAVSDFIPEPTQTQQQNDPLGSAYPIPWEWIVQTQTEFTEKGASGLRYYRSPSLVSPDGQYAVYTRVSLQAEPEMHRSRVTSVMFLENLKTGELQVIRAKSPLAEHLSGEGKQEQQAGIMSILIPVSWSQNGKQLLSRQFEGIFNSSDACDYAVIWDRQTNQTDTISPNDMDYNTAVLLGWSSSNPNQVLFRAGFLGEEDWPVLSVALNGKTILASQNESITYGQVTSYAWTGVQALK